MPGSFDANTRILLADGRHQRIADVKVGDKVLATDPQTGETTAKAVTALWIHQDDLIDLTVADGQVTTTDDHPFWNATDKQWQNADQLDPGDLLRTADGGTTPVGSLLPATRHPDTAYNLTVAD